MRDDRLITRAPIHACMALCDHRGFTLIELLVTIMLISVFAMIALPDFAGWIKSERLIAQNNDLISDIGFARAEAMRRGVRVVLCPTVNQTSCASNWSAGRMIFVDTNRDMELSAGEEIVRVRSILTGSNRLVWSGAVQRLQFAGSGLPIGGITNGLQDSFKLCDASQVNTGRQITISTLGTVESSRNVTCP